jgi:hypothetical protein
MNWKTTLMPAIRVPLFVTFEPSLIVICRCTEGNGGIHFRTVSVRKNSLYKINQSKLATKQKVTTAMQSPAHAPSPVSSTRIPSTHPDIINSACNHHEADPTLVHAIMKSEAGFINSF